MSIYFIADTHFNHANIIKYCARPFSCVESMNEILIKNWNNTIKSNDLVYHLGDVGLGDLTNILNRLHGKKKLIVGNHDKRLLNSNPRAYFSEVKDIDTIKIDKRQITLCHYSMQTWPQSHHGSWHLFGHSHGKLKGIGLSIDIGIDSTQLWRPISFEEVSNILKTKELDSSI